MELDFVWPRCFQEEERSLLIANEASNLDFKRPTKYGRRSNVASEKLQRTEGRFGPFRDREAQCEDGFAVDTQENHKDPAHVFLDERTNKNKVSVHLCFFIKALFP